MIPTCKNLDYTCKVIMLIIECCSFTDASRSSMSEVLAWCYGTVTDLIDNKFRNLLLQHVIAYGTEEGISEGCLYVGMCSQPLNCYFAGVKVMFFTRFGCENCKLRSFDTIKHFGSRSLVLLSRLPL